MSSINSLQTSEYTPVRKTRSKTGNTTFADVCFICNEDRVTDSTHKYRDGGLGTCERESAAQRLMEASQNIKDTEYRFYTAKQRLDILLRGQSFYVWVAEIRYHNSCYKRFTYSPRENNVQEFINLH